MNENLKNEVWLPIPGYTGLYEVSSLGRVKSLRGAKNCILNATTLRTGYLSVCFSINRKQKRHTVHRLVMLAFKGNSDLQVDHINSIRTDNRLSNLRYINNRSNVSRAKRINSTSPFTGVSKSKNYNKWVSQILIENKVFYLGRFNEEHQAAGAYNEALANWTKFGIKPVKRKSSIYSGKEDAVINLYKSGLSLVQIATMYMSSTTPVYTIIKNAGICRKSVKKAAF